MGDLSYRSSSKNIFGLMYDTFRFSPVTTSSITWRDLKKCISFSALLGERNAFITSAFTGCDGEFICIVAATA